MTEALTQALTQVANNNKKDKVSKQMMKHIKIFDGSNKAECITWLSQVEAAARFSNTPFHELICHSMAPMMLHVFSELSALATNADIKNMILANYSDIPSTTEAATYLQNMQISHTEPLITFNHRYKAIHKVAFKLPPNQQYNRTVIIEYTKKLPQNTRDKLLRKIAKKNSYIQTLDDAFKQAIEINRETSFVEAASGRYNDQRDTKIETQINEFDDSFQDCNINAMNTRSTNRFSNTPFRELICQSLAPVMLHVFSELSALTTDADIKNVILVNYSDIPSTTEAATHLQNMQISHTEPLITFNHRYKAIHKVAFKLPPNQQYNRTVIIEYTKKLPQNTRDKLLRKIAKKNSYIQTLDDAFKQAIEINRETSFVEAASGRYNDQRDTKIETQINELDDSFQDCDINAMNTRSTNRSGDRSFNGSFERSSSRNNCFNSPNNSRSSYRNSYPNNNNSYNKQGYNRDNNRNRGYQHDSRYEQRRQNYQNRYDDNQDRNRFDNRRRPNKYQHHRNQPKAQIVFEFSDQNMIEMMQMVRGFINFIRANPSTREQYKSNKLATRKEYNNEVNESEIHSSGLEQVQQLINEDKDIVFNILVAADYIDKIEYTDGNSQQQA